MTSQWFLFILFCGAISGLATAAEPATTTSAGGLTALVAEDSPLRKGERIVFLGDSITAVGGYHKRMAAALKEQRPDLEVTIINAGKSGHKIPDCQKRLQRDVLAKKPTLVFIYIGVNDVWHFKTHKAKDGTPKDVFEADLRDLVRQCKASGALVVVATLATIGEKHDGSNPQDTMLDEYAAITRTVTKEEGAPLCDLREAFMDYLKEHNTENRRNRILTRDGVHPIEAGDRLICDQASDAIAAAIRAADNRSK